MSAASLAAVSPVLVLGTLMCLMPAVTRPTLQFGVRVPRERAGAPVIGRERRAYYWRTAIVAVCCTLVAVTVHGHWPSWLNGNVRGLALAAGTDRDDDRYWKAGLLYVNRDDPAIVVGARFGVGWMLNFGNPVGWLLIAGFAAWWAGLAVLGAAAGM